jgi:hypothetical protein
MLRSDGVGVFLNNNSALPSTALFRDDLIRTEKNAAARIESTGSTADVGPETIVQFEGDELVLDHGSLMVNTTRGLKVRVGCLTVTPVDGANWTHYEVADVNGKVTVSAMKSDVYIDERSKDRKDLKQSARSNRSLVREGEQKSREDKCGGVYMNPSDAPAGEGAILNSLWARASGAVAVGVLTCWALCRGDDPISPKAP